MGLIQSAETAKLDLVSVVVQTAAGAPLVKATSARMVRPLMRMYPDTLHLQAGSGRRSSQSRASVSACHAQALVCEG